MEHRAGFWSQDAFRDLELFVSYSYILCLLYLERAGPVAIINWFVFGNDKLLMIGFNLEAFDLHFFYCFNNYKDEKNHKISKSFHYPNIEWNTSSKLISSLTHLSDGSINIHFYDLSLSKAQSRLIIQIMVQKVNKNKPRFALFFWFTYHHKNKILVPLFIRNHPWIY